MKEFPPYVVEINELPREHSVDWQQFQSKELRENTTWGRANALVNFLSRVAPGLACRPIRWGAESNNAESFILSSEIRKITGPSVSLKYVAEFVFDKYPNAGNRVVLGDVWRALFSAPINDPTDRVVAALCAIIGTDRKGNNIAAPAEVFREIGYIRDASVGEGMLAFHELSDAAASAERNG